METIEGIIIIILLAILELGVFGGVLLLIYHTIQHYFKKRRVKRENSTICGRLDNYVKEHSLTLSDAWMDFSIALEKVIKEKMAENNSMFLKISIPVLLLDDVSRGYISIKKYYCDDSYHIDICKDDREEFVVLIKKEGFDIMYDKDMGCYIEYEYRNERLAYN